MILDAWWCCYYRCFVSWELSHDIACSYADTFAPKEAHLFEKIMNHSIVFIIDGFDVKIKIEPNEPLSIGVQKAYDTKKFYFYLWKEIELRDERGTLLDPDRSAFEYGLEDNARLFLGLRTGAGG